MQIKSELYESLQTYKGYDYTKLTVFEEQSALWSR